MPPRHLARTAAFAVSVVAAVSPVVFVCGAAAAARTAGLARLKAQQAAAIASAATQSTAPATSAGARRSKAPASPRPTQPTGAGDVEPPSTTASSSVTPPTPRDLPAKIAPGENTTSCAWALAYLRANAAPGSTLECPGYAAGHQAETLTACGPDGCSNHIIIHVVCEASVKNEAWNSRHPNGPIDPYGHC